jgi:hypothetical protein
MNRPDQWKLFRVQRLRAQVAFCPQRWRLQRSKAHTATTGRKSLGRTRQDFPDFCETQSKLQPLEYQGVDFQRVLF